MVMRQPLERALQLKFLLGLSSRAVTLPRFSARAFLRFATRRLGPRGGLQPADPPMHPPSLTATGRCGPEQSATAADDCGRWPRGRSGLKRAPGNQTPQADGRGRGKAWDGTQGKNEKAHATQATQSLKLF
eukprot:GHVT01061102.1.p3 GENE.GHVT01061102.1~~GHVT01061102.1.p3  ORF type:complete len:131 (-),score=28.61 GHVT01061102.1:1667-2059(-)